MDKFYNLYTLIKYLNDELDLVNLHVSELKYFIKDNEEDLKKVVVNYESKKGVNRK